MPDQTTIRELIELIEAEDGITLDMETTYCRTTDCGTVGCIMGFVKHYYGGGVTTANVADHLGIPAPTAWELCYADSLDSDPVRDLETLKKPIVIRGLEALAAGEFTSWKDLLDA